MKTKGLIFNILVTFAITFSSAVIVTLLWNLIIEKSGAIVDWKTAFIFAIIFGVAFPTARKMDKN